MYLKNINCPECGTKGIVLIDGNFYNCGECNNYWGIPEKQKEVIAKITNEMDEKLTSDNSDCTKHI